MSGPHRATAFAWMRHSRRPVRSLVHRTTSGSPGRRLLTTASLRLRASAGHRGGAAGTSDGDARFVGDVSTGGQLKLGPYAGPPRVPQIAKRASRLQLLLR